MSREGARRRPVWGREEGFVLGRPGNDLLSRVLRHSTIGAEEFNGRVRDGIGFLAPRSNHRTGKGQWQGCQGHHPEVSLQIKGLSNKALIGPARVRKADRPPPTFRRTAKGADAPAGV